MGIVRQVFKLLIGPRAQGPDDAAQLFVVLFGQRPFNNLILSQRYFLASQIFEIELFQGERKQGQGARGLHDFVHELLDQLGWIKEEDAFAGRPFDDFA